MPLNKDQLLRYKILNDCLRDTSRLYNMNTLVEKVQKEVARVYDKQVSKRSVQNDVHLLQYPPYDVEFDEELRRQGFYRYADTSFCLEIVKSLSEREQSAVKQTIKLLQPIVEDVEVSTPLQQYMYLCLQRIASGDTIDFDFPNIAFENNDSLAGMGNFLDLAKAIINKQPLKIKYRSFKSEKSIEIKIHPFLLKQYNARWFLIAATDGYSNVSNYAIDRILDISIWKAKYKETNVDLAEYFKHTIGVTITNSPIENIVLKIKALRYPYVETKPFSEKQRIISYNNNYYIISFPMRINRELISVLLSYGDDIEIIEPQKLRDEIKIKIESMNRNYSVVQKDCTI